MTITDTQDIDTVQRWILIASWIYYEGDDSMVDDKFYDRIAYRLVDLQKNFPGDVQTETAYGYAFYDFDGTTGFDLFSRLTDKDKEKISHHAMHILKFMREDRAKATKKKKGK